MMFVYHYVIIPFHPQYLPRHAPQGAGIQGAGIGVPKPFNFLYSYEMKTINGYILKLVNDYKYLGSYISSSFKDFNTRKGMAWSACNDLHRIWVSDLHVNMKIYIFKTLIEPILLYGSETWTLTSKQQQRVDGTYTRLLMRVKNISWKRHPTKQQIYNDLGQVSKIIKRRRVQFALQRDGIQFRVIDAKLNWEAKQL